MTEELSQTIMFQIICSSIEDDVYIYNAINKELHNHGLDNEPDISVHRVVNIIAFSSGSNPEIIEKVKNIELIQKILSVMDEDHDVLAEVTRTGDSDGTTPTVIAFATPNIQ